MPPRNDNRVLVCSAFNDGSKTADELAIASVTRGIENPHSRTCLNQIKFRIQDILVILCFLIVLVLNVVKIGGVI